MITCNDDDDDDDDDNDGGSPPRYGGCGIVRNAKSEELG